MATNYPCCKKVESDSSSISLPFSSDSIISPSFSSTSGGIIWTCLGCNSSLAPFSVLIEISGVILDPDGGASGVNCNPNGSYILLPSPIFAVDCSTLGGPTVYCRWAFLSEGVDVCYTDHYKMLALQVAYDTSRNRSGIFFRFCISSTGPLTPSCQLVGNAYYTKDQSGGNSFLPYVLACNTTDPGLQHTGKYDCLSFNSVPLDLRFQDTITPRQFDWSSADVKITAI